MKRTLLAPERLEGRDCPTAIPTLAMAGAVPIPRTDPAAVRQHVLDVVRAESGRYDVAFLGDSIVNFWANRAGASTWRSRLAPLGAVAFGVPEDTAENLLWRVENGELAGRPKVAVVEIGTNDLGAGLPVDYAVGGIDAVVGAIRAISPGTDVLLLGLLPRGASPSDPYRAEVAAVNARIAGLADGRHVFYLDPGPSLALADGSTTPFFLPPDYVHPNARGYARLTDAIDATLVSLLDAS